MNYAILLKQLEDFEGLELKPYKCTSDKTTIGLGRNLDDYGITREEAYYLAQNNIDEIANCYLDNIAAVQKNKIITEYTSDITYNINFHFFNNYR